MASSPTRDHLVVGQLFSDSGGSSAAREKLDHLLRSECGIVDYLEWLQGVGFSRCRYYEFTQESENSPGQLVLASAVGHMEQAEGRRISFTESSLSKTDGDFPVIDFGCEDDPRPHVAALDLIGRTWIEIPIRTASRMEGVVACDWEISLEAKQPTDSDVMFLAFLGRWLLDVVRYRAKQIAVGDQLLSTRTMQLPTLGEELMAVLDEARYALGAATLAVFEFNWQSGRLVKTYESMAPEIFDATPSDVRSFQEEYFPGEHYTGKAWMKPSDRYIPLFEEIQDPDRACQRSLKRHKRLLGQPIISLLYSKCGDFGVPILLRFMNRVDYPHLTLESRRETLQIYEKRVTALHNRRSMEVFQSLLGESANSAAEATFDIDILRKKIMESLLRIGVSGARYLVPTATGTEIWNLDIESSPLLPEVLPEAIPMAFDASPVRASAAELGVFASRFEDASETANREYLVIGASEPPEIQMYLPLDVSKMSSDSDQLIFRPESELDALTRLPWFELKFCSIAVDLLGIAHSSARFYASGAQLGTSFLRYLHHEVMGTANRLADKAEAALDDIRRGLRRNEDSLLTQQTVKQALPELERLRTEMNRYLRPASLLVQDDAPISVRFEEASIGELMARALDELKDHFSESFMDYYRIHPALIVSTIQAELVRTSVVCDRFAVQRALTSMLDNAVKYSNPRFYPTGNTNYERSMSLGRTTSRGERCVVEIGARLVERLQMLEFYVTNWGSAPPTRDTSILFRAFERGGISDSRRSVPGLGIGLVVVGNCAEMHLGHAQIHSRPTLSDPLRQNEGSETTVVLRISLGLRPGDFVWTSGASLVPLKREGADLGDRG